MTRIGDPGQLAQGPLYVVVRGDTLLFVQTPDRDPCRRGDEQAAEIGSELGVDDEAGIDQQGRRGHVAGIVREQEGDGRGKLGGLGDAVQRDPLECSIS